MSRNHVQLRRTHLFGSTILRSRPEGNGLGDPGARNGGMPEGAYDEHSHSHPTEGMSLEELQDMRGSLPPGGGGNPVQVVVSSSSFLSSSMVI